METPQTTQVTYKLVGTSIASCGCKMLDLSCLCTDEKWQPGCRSDCVAYHIKAGKIEDISIQSLTVVRLIEENSSALYLDDRATKQQQLLLAKVFSGELGGSLADVGAISPPCTSVEPVPIRYQSVSGTIELLVFDTLVLQARPKPFEFTSDASDAKS